MTANIPKDAEARAYSAKFITSSDELSNREASVLKVMQAEVIPATATQAGGNTIGKYYIYALAGIPVLFLLLAARLKGKRRRGNSLAALKPIIRQ